MSRTCDYCQSAFEEDAAKCPNCGAAAGARAAPDFRFCPHCKRRLLALGSPACNYCGRALPEEYVRAREALWQKVNDARAGKATPEELAELEQDSDNALKRALKALLDLDGRKK
ncbi:MAG: double zinc ribbon domain-containing protein [Pyrinomonadaceae bacterium]